MEYTLEHIEELYETLLQQVIYAPMMHNDALLQQRLNMPYGILEKLHTRPEEILEKYRKIIELDRRGNNL